MIQMGRIDKNIYKIKHTIYKINEIKVLEKNVYFPIWQGNFVIFIRGTYSDS